MRQFAKALFGIMSMFVGVVYAYEIDTHERLSIEAYEVSRLRKDAELLRNFGVGDSDKFKNSENSDRTIRELIGDGARFEDKVLPYPRVVNHFYNPLSSKGLGGDVSVLGHPSPDWALEDRGEITGAFGFGKQEYSYRDGREFFYRALTGRDAKGTVVAAKKSERDKNFGSTFQTLGQLIHHIQDMAQPQHVRDDGHLGLSSTQTKWLCLISPLSCAGYFSLKDPSLYESWTNRSDVRGSLPTGFSQIGYDLNAQRYTATFNQPRKFWKTSNAEGLSQFTNHNFLSAGTNFDNLTFGSPAFTVSWFVDKDIKEVCANAAPECPNQKLEGAMRFYGSWVEDRFTGEVKPNSRASTYSIFDADLEKKNAKKTFSLNRFNFNEAHRFLIPRAVAYSAGLINYFFRGRMEFKADPNNPGKYIIKNLGAEDMKGTFTLYYDAKDGKRYPVAGDLAGETWVNRSIAAKGELANLGFTPPVEPAPISPGVYLLVFNGDMGEEEAIPGSTVGAVVATKVQPPSRIAFLRLADPYINSSSYDIFVIDPDGRNERNVTKSPAHYSDLAWSPDGTRLAFSSNRDGVDEIYVLNVDDGSLKNISSTPGNDSWPTWSPDGSKIAFHSLIQMDDGLYNAEILIAHSGGGQSSNLTNTPTDVEWTPKWSPDGKSILIDSYHNDLWGFALLNLESGSRRQLTVSPYPYKHDYSPVWSPDGKRIVFQSDREDHYDDVYSINIDGSNLKRLTNSPARDWYPQWSPDGTKIAFARGENGNDKIYVMDADGKNQTLISNPIDGVSDWNPGWSPDGAKIVFQKYMTIHIMNADGSNERYLTKGWLPIWSPPVGRDMLRIAQ